MGVEGEGFEPSKATPADLQSAPFVHSGPPPARYGFIIRNLAEVLEPPTASLQMRCSTIELRQLSAVQRMPRERGRARRGGVYVGYPDASTTVGVRATRDSELPTHEALDQESRAR